MCCFVFLCIHGEYRGFFLSQIPEMSWPQSISSQKFNALLSFPALQLAVYVYKSCFGSSLSNTTFGGFVCFMSAGYGYAILANVVECWMYLIYPMKFSPSFLAAILDSTGKCN